MPDRIHETLSTLRTDTERAPLADASTVRHRGTQRTRRTAVGSALAVLVLGAGAVGVTGFLAGGSDRSIEGPPATPGPTAQTWTPLELADDPLLAPADLGTIGPYSGWQRSPEAVDGSVRPIQCIKSPATLGASRSEAAQYYQDLDGTVIEHVLLFDDAAAAEAAASYARVAFRTCDKGDPAEATVTDRQAEPVQGPGDAAYRLSRLTVPKADAGIGYYEAAVEFDDNIVVVLEWSSMGNPVGNGSTDWVWTADRMQTALDRAVG